MKERNKTKKQTNQINKLITKKKYQKNKRKKERETLFPQNLDHFRMRLQKLYIGNNP